MSEHSYLLQKLIDCYEEPFTGSLKDFKDLNINKIVFLVGAGISREKPTYLPTGGEILNAIYKNFLEVEKIIEVKNKKKYINERILSHPSFIEDPNLRFEHIMGLFQKFIDSEKKILNLISNNKVPNIYHKFLANMIIRGSLVLTTNYDNLIEMSLLELGIPKEKIKPVITKKDFENSLYPTLKQGYYNIYKLHGSLSNCITGEKTQDTIIIDLDRIAHKKYHTFDTIKKNFVSNVLDKKILFLIGYSGRDDYDIIPIIKNCKNISKIIWFEHSNSNKIEISTFKKILNKEYIKIAFNQLKVRHYVNNKFWNNFIPIIEKELNIKIDSETFMKLYEDGAHYTTMRKFEKIFKNSVSEKINSKEYGKLLFFYRNLIQYYEINMNKVERVNHLLKFFVEEYSKSNHKIEVYKFKGDSETIINNLFFNSNSNPIIDLYENRINFNEWFSNNFLNKKSNLIDQNEFKYYVYWNMGFLHETQIVVENSIKSEKKSAQLSWKERLIHVLLKRGNFLAVTRLVDELYDYYNSRKKLEELSRILIIGSVVAFYTNRNQSSMNFFRQGFEGLENIIQSINFDVEEYIIDMIIERGDISEASRRIENIIFEIISREGELANRFYLKSVFLLKKAEILFRLKQFDQCLKLIDEVSLSSQIIYNTYNLARLLVLKSKIFEETNTQKDMVWPLLNEAMDFALQSKSELLLSEIQYRMALFFYNNGDYKMSKKYIIDAQRAISMQNNILYREKYKDFELKIYEKDDSLNPNYFENYNIQRDID